MGTYDTILLFRETHSHKLTSRKAVTQAWQCNDTDVRTTGAAEITETSVDFRDHRTGNGLGGRHVYGCNLSSAAELFVLYWGHFFYTGPSLVT